MVLIVQRHQSVILYFLQLIPCCFVYSFFLKRKLLQVSIQLITTGEAGYQPTGEADYQYAEVDSKLTHEQSVYHNYHTLEPDSASQENQPQYEVPVPQQHNVHMSNEVGKICKDYETLHNE